MGVFLPAKSWQRGFGEREDAEHREEINLQFVSRYYLE